MVILTKSFQDIFEESYTYVAKDKWGITDLKQEQEVVIGHMLNGSGYDVLAIWPTGWGKSLNFQIPGYMLWQKYNKTALVICPTISLMEDQVSYLRGIGVPATCVHSLMEVSDQNDIVERSHQGSLALLYLTPERFVHWFGSTSPTYRNIFQNQVSFIVLDECHLVHQWGFSFRTSFMKIGETRNQAFAEIPMLMQSASVSDTVIGTLKQHVLGDRPYRVICGDPTRSNLTYTVTHNLTLANLVRFLREDGVTSQLKPAVIFCATVRQVKDLYNQLSLSYKIPCTFYHGQMNNAEERKRNSEGFIQGEYDLMIATGAWGLGVNKKDIRSVIHLSAPVSLEQYYQESGRGGRDGLSCYCLLNMTGSRKQQEFFINQQYPDFVFIDLFYQWCRSRSDEHGQIRFNEDDFINSHHWNKVMLRTVKHWAEYYNLVKAEKFPHTELEITWLKLPENISTLRARIIDYWITRKLPFKVKTNFNLEEFCYECSCRPHECLGALKRMAQKGYLVIHRPDRPLKRLRVSSVDSKSVLPDYQALRQSVMDGAEALWRFADSEDKHGFIRDYFKLKGV